MKAQELSLKYATAVFSYALENWLEVLGGVQDKLANDSGLAEKLANADLTFADRQKDLDGIIPSGADDSIKNFLYTVLKEGNIGLLGDIVSSLGQMSKGGPMIETAQVTTAVALSDEEKDKFRQKLQAQYGDSLEIRFEVKADILGGAIVQVGDKVIDGSVVTRMDAMKNALGVKL